MKKKITGGIILLVILGCVWYFYQAKIVVTKIAAIGFPDFMLEKMVTSNNNDWIEVKSLSLDNLEDLSSYKFALIRAHGRSLDKEHVELIKKAEKQGTKVYMAGITNPEFDISNISGKEFDYISTLMQNGCAKNYRSLFNYVRNEIDKKTFFKQKSNEPYILPDNFFFHIDDEAIFDKIENYEKYYKEKGFYKKNGSKIAFLAGNINNQNSNAEHTVKLIKSLESKGLNVYPIQAWGGARLKLLQQVNPDLVIMRPHGRLIMGGADKAVQWLVKNNIPLYAPLTIFEDYEKWDKNPQGMGGGMLSMSVVMPELDGAVMPYALIAQFENEKGYKIFDAIPGRVEDFAEAASKRTALKKKENSQKKIAIYYFKGVGKSGLNASGLDVISSLYNTLKVLRKEGYNLNGLPETEAEFGKMVMAKGAVLAPYALGAFDKYLKTGKPELVEKSVYEKWCKEAMPEDMYKSVTDRYGEAPGQYMAVEKDGKKYIAVTALRFGNICLLPQPMSGIGTDANKIVHGAKMAPPHPYIASYLWTQKAFKADAIWHFGTHGSLEFTPYKQVALSSHDWSDRLIGTLPHFYLYIISNIGEGMTAKRRSYATLLTHLTPPFMKSDSHRELELIHEKIHRRNLAPKNTPLRQQYAVTIRKMAEKMNIHKSLKLDTTANYTYTDEDIEKIHEYLEEIKEEKVTSGIYTLGVPYPEHKLKETTELMSIDAIAFNLARVDAERKKITFKKAENASFVSHFYKPKARKIIRKSMNPKGVDAVIASVLTAKELFFAHNWEKKQKAGSRSFMMMRKKQPVKSNSFGKDKLPELLVKLCENDENKDYILKLESKKVFEKSSKMLNAGYRARMLKMARRVKATSPDLYKTVRIGSQKHMINLLSLMQDSVVYAETFRLLKEGDLNERILQEKQRVLKANAKKCENKNQLKILQLAFSDKLAKQIKNKDKKTLLEMQKTLVFYDKNKKVFEYCNPKIAEKLKSLSKDSVVWYNKLKKSQKLIRKGIDAIEKKEASYAQAILQVEENIRSIHKNKENLAKSTRAEHQAVVNAFAGGYTAPSSGGDPIINRRAVPTGRNMYSIDAERTPSEESWEVGKKLAKSLLANEFKSKGHYPKKVSFTLWSTNFISTEGATIAQILYLLGVEPVRGGFGSVRNLKLIPMDVLQRPRIDVVVQTSGQLRDLASSRLALINRAIALAAEADEDEEINYVAKGMLDTEKALLAKGFSPAEARKFSTQRVFGGLNGSYGTGIMGMVEKGDSWENEKEIAETYIHNMGAIYDTRENWGTFKKGLFEAALQNTEVVVHPRSSNTWGALSLDHVYEFMGGLNMAVRHVTGSDPSAYFNDFRNVSNPRMQTLEQAIGVETNSTVFNPKFIKELLKEDAAALGGLAETFRNTYGWNIMKPKAIDKYIWDNYFDIYIKDKYKLNLPRILKEKSPYAMQEMTAVMLEIARKGYWKASPEQLKELAQIHAQLVKEREAACTGFVCDNAKLRKFIAQKVDKKLAEDYKEAIKTVREVKVEDKKDNVVLKKEEQKKNTVEKTQTSNKNRVGWWIGGFLILLILIFAVFKKRKK